MIIISVVTNIYIFNLFEKNYRNINHAHVANTFLQIKLRETKI
jgi:hypothetical protein